jgi:dsDNA-specific endonuclease/ATPase MutS2
MTERDETTRSAWSQEDPTDQPPVPPSDSRAERLPEEIPEEIPKEFNTPIVLEVTDILDLHLFRPREVAEVVKTYLEEARARGFSTVRIIHGKGTGTQREIVRSVLSKTNFVSSFEDAPAQAGGWGATIAWFGK